MPFRNLTVIAIATLVCYACYAVAIKNRYANLFAEAVSIVNQEALQEVPSEQLFASAMQGMLQGFDRHSVFMSGDAFQTLDEELKGEFGGVGVYFEPEKDAGVRVLAVIPGHPADQAGLRAGDLLLAIDGKPAINLEPATIRKRMTGVVNTSVDVSYSREGATTQTTVTRKSIPIQSVHGYARRPDGSWSFALPDHPEIAYLRLSQFDGYTAVEMQETLSALDSSVTGIILDLRNNGGGLLPAAESICDMFLPPGLPMVRIKGRGQKLIRESQSQNEPIVAASVQVVVLVNRNSASASEIVAACLEDHDRATLIGEQSWGKGTVQNVIPMQTGNSALKLTTASYWPPSDRCIDRYNPLVSSSGEWGVRPADEWTVSLEPADAIAFMKQTHLRQIEGLIPEAHRESLLTLTKQNFLDEVNQSNLEEVVEEVLPPDAVPDREASSRGENGASAAPENETLNLTPEDLEKDKVLDRAIEFLQSATTAKRKAA